MHEENSFVTLTYNDENLPKDGSLQPVEVKKWLYRLREAIKPARVRFFLVGEYGELSYRPHYHLSVFGAGALTPLGRRLFQDHVERTWRCGHVLVADFSPATAAYVSGYIVKNLVDRMDPRMGELAPVFTRTSLKPGLGATFMSSVAEALSKTKFTAASLPRSLKIGSKTVPLDRYLLQKLRDASGLSRDEIQAQKDRESWERSLELRFLFEEASKAAAPGQVVTATTVYHSQMDQKIVQRLKRYEIYQQSRTL